MTKTSKTSKTSTTSTTMTRRAFLAAVGAAGASASLGAQEATPKDVAPGQHRLKLAEGDRDGLYYIPLTYKEDVRAPLCVVLHGAGGTAQSSQSMVALAEEFGVILLAPDSRDERTWDGVLQNWGPDVDFIAAAVGHVSRLCRVDPARITVWGFSDGASYSLSLGISYGDVFSRIVSMSPGVMQPIAARGKPKIFISHGISDPVMPIDVTSRRFVPRLKNLGYDVTYREYEGTHRPSPPIVREAFKWAFG
jgi:phospholipase/carboxylesterase